MLLEFVLTVQSAQLWLNRKGSKNGKTLPVQW
jgi:hypothetical protein